jgi:hypothetical protein
MILNMNSNIEQQLIAKVRDLSPGQLTAVFNFIEKLANQQDIQLTQAAAATSEPSFADVWDNEEDAAYDRL